MKRLFTGLVGVLITSCALAQAPSKPQAGYTYKVEPGLPGKQVVVSAQRPYDEKGNLVGAGNLALQARQVFENLRTALKSVGMSLSDVNQVTYHLKGISGATNALSSQQVANIGATYFTAGMPKISAVKSIPKIVSDDVLLEVEVVAVK